MATMVESPVAMLNGEVLVEPRTAPASARVRESTKAAIPAEIKDTIQADVLVIGAGFSGITAVHRLRQIGLRVKCFESGEDFGGVWYWNRYPGARVDSECPFYQLRIPEVWREWSFTQRFPDHRELRRYMAHIDKVLNLRQDTFFNARVNDATWDDSVGKWTVTTVQGHKATAKYLISCTGLLHRTYTPEFEGLKDYKGELYHSGDWDESFSAKGKKVAIIGAGATAVQITQELGKDADELKVFVRRPSYCLPLQQREWSELEQTQWKSFYPALFQASRNSGTGFPCERQQVKLFDVDLETREKLFDRLWNAGGFHFLRANYTDVVIDKEANKVVYDYWRRRVCERLTDKAKQDIMAPEVAPYYFGTKRTPLEHDYYDVLNQANVHIHDLNTAPLKSFSETGLVMADGQHYDFDAVVLATGFDSYSGSLTRMGLKNRQGVDLRDEWAHGVHTFLGITISGFPNFFMSYTPQAPTALSNGPTIIECQIENIVDAISKLEARGARSIEPTREAEERWKEVLDGMSDLTLMRFTDSWWNGANIPGKKSQSLVYVGGIDVYEKQVREELQNGAGFDIVDSS